MINNGRKIPSNMENPFDDLIISFCSKINPYLHRLGVTPNMLTTISLTIGILACYFIYESKFITGCLLYLIAYVFDCMDGNLARMTDNETIFGDIYDHTCDILKFSLFIFVICYNKNVAHKAIFCTVSVILGMLAWIHLGYQEDIYNKPAIFLKKRNSETPEAYIRYTKFFGVGTLILTQIAMLIAFTR